MIHDQVWAIILAGGEGERVRTLTIDPKRGTPVPKQYFSFFDDASLLETTLRRARRAVSPDRIITVVLERHRPFWEHALADLPPENVIVQPENRGTAVGVLAPLLAILTRDPESRFVLFPSDHHVDDEYALEGAVRRALLEVARDPAHPVLLGVTADRPDTQYGWIVPGAWASGGVARAVSAFVEKPSTERAEALFAGNAFWSSMMMAGETAQMVALFDAATPELRRMLLPSMFGKSADVARLDAIWRSLPPRDLSRDVLEPAAGQLRVVKVPPCGWTDLGTPERVAEVRVTRSLRPQAMAS